ncbi:MAG: EAL domain-containing protein [Methylotenera sp.]
MTLLPILKKRIVSMMSSRMMPWLLSGIVLLIGSVLTTNLWWRAQQDDTKKLRIALESAADITANNIHSRLNAFQVIMRGVKGHIDGSHHVTADEFHDYIQSLRLETDLGLKGVGLVELIKPGEKDRHIAEIRKLGFPKYQIKPEGNRDIYAPITHMEPFDKENALALGFDPLTVPPARIAMEQSRDANDIRITSHFTLVQDAGKSNVNAFVMYLPIYKKDAILNTLAERRAAITGWVDVPFRMNDFMAGLRGEIAPDLDLEIHDGMQLSDISRLYHSDKTHFDERRAEGRLLTSRTLDIGGTQWTLLLSTTPAFKERILTSDKPELVALVGIALTMLLSLLTWFLIRSQQSADARYQKLFDQAGDGVLVLNRDHSFLEINNAALMLLGYERETLLKMRLPDILAKHELVRLEPSVREVMAGRPLHEECVYVRKDGSEFTAEIGCRKLEGSNYFVIIRDLTERKKAEERIKRLTQLYQALSEINQAIVRMNDESDLFPLVCQCAVDFGGMKMAWIGQLDEASSRVLPVAVYGNGVDYVDNLMISVKKDLPEGQGPTGTALRENRTVIINDYLTNPITKHWHDRAAQYGWGSAATFPIQRNGKPFAVLTVYHSATQGFDEEAINLLNELTFDISFALDNFDRETQRQQLTHDLKNAYDRINHILNVNPAIVYSLKFQPDHSDFIVDFIGIAIQKLTGYPSEDWYTPKFWINHIHPEDQPIVLQAQQRLLEQGSLNHQYRFLHADGRVVWIEDQLMLIRDSSGNPSEAVGAWLDITDRKVAEQNLRINAQVFEFSREGIITTDTDNTILSVNKAFTEITGYTAEEVIGKNPRILASGTLSKTFYKTMWRQIINTGYWQGELLNRRKDGELYPQRLSISTVRNQDGKITQHIAIISDLSEHKLAEERIQFLSNFDPLTLLPNRNLLRDRAKLALATAKRAHHFVALLYLDLDRFKIINESLGPNAGDELLKELSVRLAKSLRPDDTLSRQGGDEFVLLLPDTDAEGAAHVAKKMLDIISRPFTFDAQRITLTSSIGIAEFPQDGDNFDQLAQSADAALYRAKQAGRNNFQFFTQQMHEQANEVLHIENELRRALEQDEFLLYYQPKIDASTSKIIGAEALIRWQHPQKGLVSPASFIPIAEESGIINEIGNWVLNTAVRQIAQWQADGIAIVPVAINLSLVQFRQDSLYQSVYQALRESGLDPAMLELEMTEGIAMENSERTISVLNQLNTLGVRLSIDDFGTGYSSLSYLKRFKIDNLKIDQSFVHDLDRHPEDAAIITAIIGMAKSLGFKTIAEGVETQEQLDFLRDKQCDQIQGYLFSKPVPEDDFVQLLHKGEILLN